MANVKLSSVEVIQALPSGTTVICNDGTDIKQADIELFRGLIGPKGDPIFSLNGKFPDENGAMTLNANDVGAFSQEDAADLAVQVSKKASTASYAATLAAGGWSASAPFTQTVSVPGILATDNPFVDVDMSGATTSSGGIALTEAWAMVGRVTAASGSITATCYEEKPTTNLPILLKVVR